MAQPAGSIDITDDDQYIGISNVWSARESTRHNIHAYVIFRPIHMLPMLSDLGAQWEDYELGARLNAEADVDIKIAYRLGGSTAGDVYEGSSDGSSAAWSTMTPDLAAPAAAKKKVSDLFGLRDAQLLEVVIGLTLDSSAGVSAISAVSIRGKNSEEYTQPIGEVNRDSSRVYAPGNFLSAYHGMTLICDTLCQYVAQSRISQVVPLFGMPVVAE